MDLSNSNKSWSDEEMSRLSLEFKAGMSAFAIADAHKRRIVEITSRLDAMRYIHFRAAAWYNSYTTAVWLPFAEKRARSLAEQAWLDGAK